MADTPRSALADAVLTRLTAQYGAAADPVRAVQAAAYMRDQFTHLGISTPRRRELSREVLRGLDPPDTADCVAVALGCWALPEREYRYFAADYLRRYVGRCDSGMLDTVRTLTVTEPWWDTVDVLAAHVTGPLVAADPALVAVMDEWVREQDMWLVRTAILHQLHYGAATDQERLFRYCTLQSGHRDFFVRKAIGWALRHYARTAPEAVRAYVERERARLSPLSVREALKHL